MNCKNKKIISILIASGILLSPNNAQAMESMVDFINEDSKTIEENIDKIEKEEAIQSEDDTNIVPGLVHEIELGEGEFVPDLTNNPEGYETIKVKTTGNKKLVEQDYANLRYSRIPKIDLSSAQSDYIPDRAFNSSSALKEIKFPQGLTSIGDEAFMTCSNLSGKLELPDTLKSIGNHSFYSCSSLSGNLELPNSLTSIGSNAFVSCVGFSGDLVIPDSVETIGDNAFTYCDGFNGNLKLSNSLKSIGANAFVSLKGLSGELIIPDSIEFIGESAFEGCTGFSGDLVIPNSLKSLSDGVFAGCTGFDGTLKLPDTLETIGFATFNGCAGFKGKLVIPNSVKTIGNRAFGYCKGFSGELIIPDSVTTIGAYSFNGCKGLDGTLKLSDSLTDIGIGAFYKCSGFSGDLVIPNSLATLGNDAFKNTNLDKIFIKVNLEDKITDYRKSIIDVLPTKAKIIIDTPYDFDISKTWLENTDKVIAKPIVKNLVNGVESELVDGKGEKVSLYIPSIYEESNITVLKDGKIFNLPTKNHDDKYIFTEDGNYEVTIKTSLGNVSVMNFKVNNEVINIDKESPKIYYKLSTEDLTNKNVTITVNASDNVGIEKIILPDNSEVNASTASYEVSQNGDYTFIAVDKSGNREEIIVKVSNIMNQDITTPELRSISVDKKVVKPGDKVTVTMDIINLDSLKPGENIVVEWGGVNSHQLAMPKVVYNEDINKYQYTVEIDGTMLNSMYKIFTVFIINEFGDEVKLDNDKVDLSNADFEVVEGVNSYKEIIKSATIDKKEVQIGQNINISVKLANNSYVDTIGINYKNEEDTKSIELKYNKITQKYEGKLTIDENTKLGIWKPENIQFKSEDGRWLSSLYDSSNQISDDFKFEVIDKKEENKPVEGIPEDTVKPEDNIIENLPQIEGIEFGQGNGTESNPLEILIQKNQGIEILFSELDNRFEYNIVDEPVIEGDYKIYKIKLNNKTVVVNDQVKSNENSSYIKLKVNVVENADLIAKLDKIFGENNNDSNGGDIISPVPPTTQKPQTPEVPSVPPTQKPVEFNDIKGHWAEETIKEFTDKNFINGYEDNTFKPNNNMTRAEFVKVVNKVFGYTQKGEEQFTDVNENDWFYDDICIGIKAGYIKGKSKDIFAPNENITREEVAMILTNIMENKDENLDKLNAFKDGNKTSQWAQSSVEGAIEAGYLNGDDQGLLNPTNNITRAEAISMLSRVK